MTIMSLKFFSRLENLIRFSQNIYRGSVSHFWAIVSHNGSHKQLRLENELGSNNGGGGGGRKGG